MMNRRELIKHIALLTGASVVGAEWFLTACKNEASSTTAGHELFSASEVRLMDEIAETIIPRTQTPGAKDAQTGAFMAAYIRDCYDQESQQIAMAGLKAVEQASLDKHKTSFVKLESGQKNAVLQAFADEAKAAQNADPDQAPHFFTLFQQLTLLGFFTSEQGYTQVLRFELVPGKYEGCIDYTNGQKAWAN